MTVAERPDGLYDFVHRFVRSKAEIDALEGEAMAATRPDGMLWISYPKRSSKVPTDVTRDAGWEAVEGAGWLGVRQVAVDAVWSALRFRPVGSIPRWTRGGMGDRTPTGDG